MAQMLVAASIRRRADEAARLRAEIEQIATSDRFPIELGLARAHGAAAYVIDGAPLLFPELGLANPAEGQAYAQAAVTDAERTNNPHQLAFAHLGRLAIAATTGDDHTAARSYEQAQHWARLAGNQRVLDNAPLWMAIPAQREPRHAIALVRPVLLSMYASGFWAYLDFALGDLIPPLIQLHRDRAAALAIGGFRALRPVDDARDRMLAKHETILHERLHTAFDRHVDKARTMNSATLVRQLLQEIDDFLRFEEA